MSSWGRCRSRSDVVSGALDAIGPTRGRGLKSREQGVRYDAYHAFVKRVVKEQERLHVHWNSSHINKEEFVREIQLQDGIEPGLISVLTCVEQCQTNALRRRGEQN